MLNNKLILKSKWIFSSKEDGMLLKKSFDVWKATFYRSWNRSRRKNTRSRSKTDRLRNTDCHKKLVSMNTTTRSEEAKKTQPSGLGHGGVQAQLAAPLSPTVITYLLPMSSVYLRCKKCNCYYIYWRGQSAAVIFLVEDRLSGIPADHCCLGTRQQHLGFNCSQSASQATVNK